MKGTEINLEELPNRAVQSLILKVQPLIPHLVSHYFQSLRVDILFQFSVSVDILFLSHIWWPLLNVTQMTAH